MQTSPKVDVRVLESHLTSKQGVLSVVLGRLSCLCILNNANLGRSQDSAIQLVSLALSEEDITILLAINLCEEGRLVGVGVELSPLALQRIEPLDAVLFQRGHQDAFRHHEAPV